MSAEAGSPISTYFRVCDGVRVRFADNRAGSDNTMLLLAPWPESLWAFRRIWSRVSAVGRVVAIDLPGFGHSDGRPELIAQDLGSVPGPSDRRVGPGSSPRRRPGRRHGRGALRCREGARARHQLDHRRRRGPHPRLRTSFGTGERPRWTVGSGRRASECVLGFGLFVRRRATPVRGAAEERSWI